MASSNQDLTVSKKKIPVVGIARPATILSQIKGIIIPAVDFTKPNVYFEIPQSVHVEDNLELEVEVVIPKSRQPSVSARIKSLCSGTITNCQATKKSTGKTDGYLICHKVIHRGRHELFLYVNEQEVQDCPFHFVASLPPTKLDKPIKTWKNIGCPTAITTNSIGEILIGEREKDIFLLHKDGKKLIECPNSKFTSFKGIAVDADDNIYCTIEGHEILKIEKKNLAGNYSWTKYGHRGVVVVGEEVLACAAFVNGTIPVYDRNLEYQREIQYSEGGEFYDISADSKDNLYVADNTNDVIHVFSIHGIHLHSFKTGHPPGEESILSPVSVHVFQQHVYVGYNCQAISVFTTGGTYVNTFGYQDENYYLGGSCFVTVDKDGLVYSAESNRDQVRCF